MAGTNRAQWSCWWNLQIFAIIFHRIIFFPHALIFMLTRCRCIFSECGLQGINSPFRLMKRWFVWKHIFMHPVCRFKVKLSGTENSQRNVIFYNGHYLNERLLQQHFYDCLCFPLPESKRSCFQEPTPCVRARSSLSL